MASTRQRFVFDPKASAPFDALAVVFDLEGFSRFFSQPDVHNYVPQFLNQVFRAIRTIFGGGDAYWMGPNSTVQPLPQHRYQKFLGDGGLYLFPVGPKDLTKADILELVSRIWDLKTHFDRVVRKTATSVPLADVPQRIRFGLARGSAYKLTYHGTRDAEYVGYCINLAARLQGYCPALGFIASARLQLTEKELRNGGYVRVVAKKLKNFQPEIVFVDEEEYDALDQDLRLELFDQIPAGS